MTLALLWLCCYSPNGGATAVVFNAAAAAAAAGCLWSVWPLERSPGAWLPVENTDQPPTCPEPCPLRSLPLTFAYQRVAVIPMAAPVWHIWWLLRRMWNVADEKTGKLWHFMDCNFCNSAVFVLFSCNQFIQLFVAGGRPSCSIFNVSVNKQLFSVSAAVIAHRMTDSIVNQIDVLFSSFRRYSAST